MSRVRTLAAFHAQQDGVGLRRDGKDGTAGYDTGVRKRKWFKVLTAAVVAMLGLAVAAALGALWWVNSSLHRLPVSLPGRGGVWLIVGVDDRADAGSTIMEDTGTGEPGARADILILAKAEGQSLRLLSLDRRIVVLDAAKVPGRLGASWLDGPQRTVDLLCQGLQVGVDHLVKVDFRTVVDIVDAVGGIDVRLEYALRDEPAHLDIAAGEHHVDGRTALALVRSRQGEIMVDGQWKPEPSGAEGRQRRAGMVMTSLMSAVSGSGFSTQWAAAEVVRQRLEVDPGLGVQDLIGLRGKVPSAEVISTEAVAEEDLMTSLLPESEQQLTSFRDGSCQS